MLVFLACALDGSNPEDLVLTISATVRRRRCIGQELDVEDFL
jgi:hypothetical protein